MNFPAWKYYFEFFRNSLLKIGAVIGLSAGQSLTFLFVAFIVRYSFDDVFAIGEKDRLLLVVLGLASLILLNIGITLGTRYVTRKITTQVICDLRDELLDKLFIFPRSYYSDVDLGRLHAGIVQYTQRLDIMNNTLVARSLPAFVIVIGLLGVLIYLNWWLFLILAVTTLPMYLVSRYAKKRIQDKVIVYNRIMEKLSKGLLFILQTMDLIRIQTAEEGEIRQQKEKHDEMRILSFEIVWADAIFNSVMYGIFAVSGIIILVVGGMAVISQAMTLGELIAFYIVVNYLSTNISSVLSSVPLIIEGNEALTNLYEILKKTDRNPYCGKTKIDFMGAICLRDVSFSYPRKQVFHSVDLVVQPGKFTIIMGPNGSGKSTIAYLILGFYRPQSGGLFADGHPYDDLDIAHFRKYIGVVQQDPIVFSGTIWENITYGKPDSGLAEVEKAARISTAYEFIEQLPNGFETLTGESGVLLSGGQRQRIAIARALLRNPKLLILDEPTNHLDPAVKAKLIHNLKKWGRDAAVLVISHDRDLTKEADVVLQLLGDTNSELETTLYEVTN
jgi:ATP-binding cassette subfamily B protein